MFHVQLKPNVGQWITWAYENELHPWVIDYITQRPDHLFSESPKTEEPYSTPRLWHMLSDALKAYGAGEKEIPEESCVHYPMDVFPLNTQGCLQHLPNSQEIDIF